MLLAEIDSLLSRYTWLRDMANYVTQMNRQAEGLKRKVKLTKKDKARLKELRKNLKVLNPTIDFYIEMGLKNPPSVCMHLYYEYKQLLHQQHDKNVVRMFERIRKDYFREIGQTFDNRMN